MFLLLVVLNAVSAILAEELAQDVSANIEGVKEIKGNLGALSLYAAATSNQAPVNRTYYDKDDNQLRLPNKVYEEQKKKKKPKKSPKRTIQKIIKKGKSRSRKIYVNPVTWMSTISSEKTDNFDNDYTQRNDDITTESNQRRRYRKSSKVARYPMPFHKLQPRKDTHSRYRRDVERNDVYILKDLDEIEFLSKEDGNNVVKAHITKYW